MKFHDKAYIVVFGIVLMIFFNIISFFIEIFLGGLAGSIAEIISFILPLVILNVYLYKKVLSNSELCEYEKKYFRNFLSLLTGGYILVYLFNNYTVQEYFFKLLDYLNIINKP